jgi:hypothetical protein
MTKIAGVMDQSEPVYLIKKVEVAILYTVL